MSFSKTNLFLDRLSPKSRNDLISHSAEVFLPQKTIVQDSRDRPKHAYFLSSGLLSTIFTTATGQSAEVGVTGHEGILNALFVIGPAQALNQSVVQLEATAHRILLSDLRRAFDTSPEIRGKLLEFVQNEALACSIIAGCNRLHSTEQRMAHWLLMVHDRVQDDDLGLTQTFLAIMLGSGRPTVTLAAGALQRKGLLKLHRGHVTILDWSGLERVSCDCHLITGRLQKELYSHF